MNQKLKSCALLFFILLLITSSKAFARSIATKQGEEEVKHHEITSEPSILDMEGNDTLNELTGLDANCDNGEDDDEECLKRRVIAEAHLDYIYTQHHRP